MEKLSGKFDLSRLLMTKKLNIVAVMGTDEELTLHKYYDRIELFLQKAMSFDTALKNIIVVKDENFFLNALESFSAIKEDIDNFIFKELEDFKLIFTEMGAIEGVNLSTNIENYLKAHFRDLANEEIGKLSIYINKLYDAIKPSYKSNAKATADMKLSDAVKHLTEREKKRKARILAIDDVPAILNAIGATLKPFYEVYSFTKVDHALKFLDHSIPELFLLDIEMPGMDGYSFMNLVRKMEEHKDTPVIFLTGNATKESLQMAVEMGAADFIKKPVDYSVLLEKIERHIIKKPLL